MDRERWAAIQDGEFAYHANKNVDKVLDYKLPYWRALLASLPPEIPFGADSRVLDLGCGGTSVLLAVDAGSRVGLDPLIDRYRAQFPFLDDDKGIEWINAPAEEVEFDRPFDVIFTINSFDHVYDPAQVVRRIAGWLKPGGFCVVTMNSHNTRFFRDYYRRLYRVIDHHHPFQFAPSDVKKLFTGFTQMEAREIDDLWLPYAEGYYRDVLNRSVEDKRKWLRGAANPFKWPMGFCKFALDMPPHKRRSGQRSIYSEYLYVFKLDSNGASA
jgi:SAM-dependent methyltransferase